MIKKNRTEIAIFATIESFKLLLKFLNKFSALLMIAALAWLTVSLPYVYAARKHLQETENNTAKKDNTNPLANANEEKPPSNSTVNEEYLHGQQLPQGPGLQINKKLYLPFHENVYIAFHGEQLTPPPNLHS